MLDSQQLWGSRMRPKSNFTEITTEVCPVPSTDTSSLYVFPAASVDVSPLGPVALPSPLKSPPCTIERAVLPDIAFPPPGEGEIEEDILEQILPGGSLRLQVGQFPGPGRTDSSRTRRKRDTAKDARGTMEDVGCRQQDK